MSNAATVPAPNDLLCEGCGYTLNGLPTDSRCPECGKPIAESIGAHRHGSSWEQSDEARSGFVATTRQVLFRTRDFFLHVTTRGSLGRAHDFARLHWIISSMLFTLALGGHMFWYVLRILGQGQSYEWHMYARIAIFAGMIVIAPLCYLSNSLVTRLASKLTTMEATYRGYRLPYDVVLRAMYFHAAHYLPVALGAAVTTCGYGAAVERGWLGAETGTTYLYILCGEVVVAAFYLFETYWVAMRNIMYANR